MRVGFKKMNWGGGQRSFGDVNEARRKRSAQAHKLREARAARRREIAQNAINQMQQNANIFNIKTDASYTSIEQSLIVAQQRAVDAARSGSSLGQNASVTA